MSDNRKIEITLAVARYILNEARTFFFEGVGLEPGNEENMNNPSGFIDEVQDTEFLGYMNALMGFLRYVAGILEHAVNDVERLEN